MSLRPRTRPPAKYQNSISSVEQSSSTSRRHRPDYGVFVLTSLLLLIGLVVVYSISPALAASQHISQNYFITKQLIDVGLAVAGFFVAANLAIRRWQGLSNPLLIIALFGSVLVLVTPINELYPAHRWIRLGSFSFQIVELIKLALIVWLANFLARQWALGKLADLKATLRPLLFILLAIGIVVAKLQSDLGSAAVAIAIMGLMAFMVGIPLKKVALISVGIILLLTLAIASTGYRRDRLAAYLHPGKDCQDTSYQACQALISVGSGGIFGLGLGYGVQAYGYQPEAANDSIFAILAEKFGFVGTTMIIVLYGIFIARLKKIIQRSSDQFSRLIVVGVLAWLSTQMIINIGGMIGLLPLKGITLPLISQGGTSMVFLTVALGIVFQISRYTSYNVTQPKISQPSSTGSDYGSSDRRGFRRPYNTPTAARPRT
ncbi:cell division protein FtsW [Candidatus Saccharibacteria bacterium]|nr:cell division protein FtsW [Candidatus Saccharibacteria bacterium]